MSEEEQASPPLRRRDLRRHEGEGGARRGPLLALLLGLTVVLAVADQATKYLVEAQLDQGEVVPLLGDVIGLQLVYNPGAAFSIATGLTWVLTVVAVVVVVAVLRISRKLGSTAWAVALGLLLGGCLGNLYDRLFREPGFGRGHVVDFINYNGWFVGNVADIAIVGAAVLIAVLALLGREVDGTRAEHGEHAKTRDGEDGPEPDADESAEAVSPETSSPEAGTADDGGTADEGTGTADEGTGTAADARDEEAPGRA